MVDDSACLSRICRGDNFYGVCTVQDMHISRLSNPRLSIYATNEDCIYMNGGLYSYHLSSMDCDGRCSERGGGGGTRSSVACSCNWFSRTAVQQLKRLLSTAFAWIQ